MIEGVERLEAKIDVLTSKLDALTELLLAVLDEDDVAPLMDLDGEEHGMARDPLTTDSISL